MGFKQKRNHWIWNIPSKTTKVETDHNQSKPNKQRKPVQGNKYADI
jgi:hypothetical protein